MAQTGKNPVSNVIGSDRDKNTMKRATAIIKPMRHDNGTDKENDNDV